MLGLCALFISLTLVVLSLTDISWSCMPSMQRNHLSRGNWCLSEATPWGCNMFMLPTRCVLALCNMLGLRLHRLSFRYVWLNYSMVEGLLWHESFKGCKNLTELRNTFIAQNVIQNYHPQYISISFCSVWLNCSKWVRALNGSALSRERLHKKFHESRIQSET